MVYKWYDGIQIYVKKKYYTRLFQAIGRSSKGRISMRKKKRFLMWKCLQKIFFSCRKLKLIERQRVHKYLKFFPSFALSNYESSTRNPIDPEKSKKKFAFFSLAITIKILENFRRKYRQINSNFFSSLFQFTIYSFPPMGIREQICKKC